MVKMVRMERGRLGGEIRSGLRLGKSLSESVHVGILVFTCLYVLTILTPATFCRCLSLPLYLQTKLIGHSFIPLRSKFGGVHPIPPQLSPHHDWPASSSQLCSAVLTSGPHCHLWTFMGLWLAIPSLVSISDGDPASQSYQSDRRHLNMDTPHLNALARLL
ncbi:hypothetical protein DL98DRAFT_255233 [Cadophora sp. DSE1049]|nr:hypothetical protein DL98DRAFT_255233 [Cadophora sp. DSE1049]